MHLSREPVSHPLPSVFPFLERIQVFVILFAAKKEARVDGEVVSSWWPWVRGSLSKDLNRRSWQCSKSRSCFEPPAVATSASGRSVALSCRGLIRSSSFGTACSECRGWARTAPLTHSLGTRPIWEWSRGPGSRTPQCPFHHGVPTKPGESRSADRGLPCNDQLALYRLLRAAGETSKTRKTLSQGRSSVNES